ncbi:MAG: single-stranded-DNA-specific exonuclease RecJ [Chloroflexota bacterium]
MSLSHSRWNLCPPVPEAILTAAPDLPPFIVQLLYNRGITELADLPAFLAADRSLSADPFRLPDMDRAVGRLYRALLSGETMAVYGDYDVDGVTGTALLVKGLTALGGKVIPYIPHRLTEGYGLKVAALEKLKRQGASLVITVDCGITAIAEAQKARRLGLDMVITDHHTPLADLPVATAVVNPKLPGSAYPCRELAGVGVALKLVQAILISMGREDELEGLMDLAALGTVADMVPLLGENRYLVKRGLERLNTVPRAGIREIMAQNGLEGGSLNPETISWVIAPRLNTADRLAHAITSYNLLMTDSADEAGALARWLEGKNTERQNLTAEVFARSRQQIIARGIAPILVASDGDYPGGVIGIVASRIAEEFYRPAIIVRRGERFSSGSCRSIPEFNITLALNQCRHLLSQFGGHARAAGFTLPTANLADLEQALLELATRALDGLDLRPQLDIDTEVRLPELNGRVLATLQQLAPFGQGNPLPTFLSRGVEVADCRTMGGTGKHLRLKLRQGGTIWEAVAFGWGSCLAEVSPRLDIVYNLEVDRWRGEERLRLNLLDFAPLN